MTRYALAVTAVFLVLWVVWPWAWSLAFVLCLAAAVLGGAIIRAQQPRRIVIRQARPKRRGRTRFVLGLGIGLHGVWPFLVFYRRPR